MEKLNFKVGDTVKVMFKVIAGSKTKPTPFEGIIIAIRGASPNKTFTVRKVASNKIAVERIFPFDSPIVDRVKVIKEGMVRRAKLYYLRNK